MVLVCVATPPAIPPANRPSIGCRVFGHNWRFHATGADLMWDCARCGTPGGMKHYDDPARAARYAAAFEDERGRAGPALHALHDAVVALAQAPPPHRGAMRIRVGPETDFAGAIYGQVLAGGAVVALSRHDETPIQIATAVAATMIVFWIAHVYALVLSRSVVDSDRIRIGDFRRLAVREWPMVQAAAPAVIALVLAAAGVWSRETGITIALLLGVADLFAWGIAIGRRAGRSTGVALATGASCAAFGALLIALKALVH